MAALSDPGYPAAAAAGATDADARTLGDLLRALRRRRWPMLSVFAVLALLAAVTALVMPAVYRSTATILIQEQEIPQELVRSTITSYADERIQVIAQQVMTRATLLALVDRHGLYAKARQRETNEEILERMRRDIKLTPISAEVTDRRTGSPARATIAFSLAYDSEAAASAQRIANELTSLFLSENLKSRQQRAAETTSFLDDELTRVGEHISELEARLAAFKQRHQGRTPDLNLANMMSAERAEGELRRIEREIGFVTDRVGMLEAQLAETRPHAPLSAGGASLEPDERLRALQLQLASARASFSDNHPDVRRLQREVSQLQAQLQTTAGPRAIATATAQAARADREQALARLSAQLEQLRQRYADDHPDVLRLRRTHAALADAVRADEAAAAPGAPPGGVGSVGNGFAPRVPDNPVYLSLRTQLDTSAAQLTMLRNERRELQDRLGALTLRVSQAPEVEREHLELIRDLDASRALFRDLREKQAQASAAEQLERSRKAERFTVIEPPALPERPQRPNRALILGLGLLLAVAGAAAAAALLEALDRRIGSAREIVRVLQVPVLAELPPMQVAAAAGRRWRVAAIVAGSSLLALLLAAAAAHHFVMPLDVAWFSVLRRAGL